MSANAASDECAATVASPSIRERVGRLGMRPLLRSLVFWAGVLAVVCGCLAWYVQRERERARLAQPLVDAVAAGDAGRVSLLLARGADPNVRVDENGKPVII